MNLHRVHGPPGTGKTYYLTRQCEVAADKYGGGAIVVCSLTKAAATEVASRVNGVPKQNVGTLHAHAYQSLGRPQIVETSVGLKAWNEYCGIASWRIDSKHAADPENAEPEQPVLDDEGIQLLSELNINRARMMDEHLWRLPVQRFWKKWCEFKRETRRMDFMDLIEIALSDVDEHPQGPAVIMADEAQDMSRVEFALLRKWGSQAQQVVIVGDQDQNLYQWRGSDPEAFVADEAATMRVLSRSRRVPAAVHALATRWITRIPGRAEVSYEPRFNDVNDEGSGVAEGEVRHLAVTYRDPLPLLREFERDIADGKTVMVLASCGYMLAPLIAELKSAGFPFHNPYRTKRGDWNPLRGGRRLLAFVRPLPVADGGENTMWTWKDMDLWTDPLQAQGVMIRGSKSQITLRLEKDQFKQSQSNEQVALSKALSFFEDDHQHNVIDCDIEWWEQHLRHNEKKRQQFPLRVARTRGYQALRDEPSLVVGTIHSVKGGEADSVYLFPDLSPVAYIGGYRFGPGHPGCDAITRQFYVGMTRARETLTLLAPSRMESVQWMAKT